MVHDETAATDTSAPPERLDDLSYALRRVRLRLGTAEDGLDGACIQLTAIPLLPAEWRQEFENNLRILSERIATFRTLMNGR